jgi:hypothetical protein
VESGIESETILNPAPSIYTIGNAEETTYHALHA